ncbi:hypothetical protein J6590_060359 [Homalodisca vitripennis]|nr:hypothetical protein J6590_060359 [Homalodisca vitripennis]
MLDVSSIINVRDSCSLQNIEQILLYPTALKVTLAFRTPSDNADYGNGGSRSSHSVSTSQATTNQLPIAFRAIKTIRKIEGSIDPSALNYALWKFTAGGVPKGVGVNMDGGVDYVVNGNKSLSPVLPCRVLDQQRHCLSILLGSLLPCRTHSPLIRL